MLNLIPVPPLDGASAIALVLPESFARGYRKMLRTSPYLPLLGLYLAWQVIRPLNHAAFQSAVSLSAASSDGRRRQRWRRRVLAPRAVIDF